ncbi:MAG: hypothetical protein ACQEWW_22845 [Bacillota bacterium]
MSISNKKVQSIKILISESMEVNCEMTYLYLKEDQIVHFIGTVYNWNEKTDDIKILNKFNNIIGLKLKDLLAAYRILENN